MNSFKILNLHFMHEHNFIKTSVPDNAILLNMLMVWYACGKDDILVAWQQTKGQLKRNQSPRQESNLQPP